MVPQNASLIFPPLKYGGAHARKVCPSVRIRTRFPLVPPQFKNIYEEIINANLTESENYAPFYAVVCSCYSALIRV